MQRKSILASRGRRVLAFFQGMMFFLPAFLILFGGILAKYLLLFVFKMMGWRGAGFVLEERVGAVLFLVCSAAMAGIAYWYPWYLCTYYAAPDDRYGMAFIFAFPFYFIGAAIAGMAFYRLLKAVVRGKRDGVDVVIAVCGGLLALAGFSPLFMLGWRILSMRTRD